MDRFRGQRTGVGRGGEGGVGTAAGRARAVRPGVVAAGGDRRSREKQA